MRAIKNGIEVKEKRGEEFVNEELENEDKDHSLRTHGKLIYILNDYSCRANERHTNLCI